MSTGVNIDGWKSLLSRTPTTPRQPSRFQTHRFCHHHRDEYISCTEYSLLNQSNKNTKEYQFSF